MIEIRDRPRRSNPASEPANRDAERPLMVPGARSVPVRGQFSRELVARPASEANRQPFRVRRSVSIHDFTTGAKFAGLYASSSEENCMLPAYLSTVMLYAW